MIILKHIFVVILTTLVTYLTSSFLAWDMNPENWIRAGAFILWLFLTVPSFVALNFKQLEGLI